MKSIIHPTNRAASGPSHRNQIAGLLVALCLLPMLTGCALLLVGAGGAAGAAGVAWVRGDLEATLNADPREIEQAAIKAFEALSIPLVSSKSSALDGEVIGRTATDTKVSIKIESTETDKSRISIRVGTFGDQQMSRRLLDEIQQQL